MNRSDLHPYQLRAVDFIKSHRQSALFLEMGLGKTVSTLTAISDLIQDLEIRSALVVGPRKVIETTWTDETEKWEHLRWLRITRVIGTEKKRIEALQSRADIYVISRDLFVWLIKYYRAKVPFDMAVLDELTSFKSSKAQRFKAFRLVRSQFDRIVGLTGTPAPNGYLDLYGQIYCLDGGVRLGRYKTHYLRDYFDTVRAPQGYNLHCELRRGAPDALMKQYRKFQKDCVMELKREATITAANAAALMGKLSQFCNGAIYDEEHMVHEVHGEKLAALQEIVEAAGSPVLVFYLYRHDIARIQQALSGIVSEIRVYEGEQEFRDWNAGRIDVLLAHPASCSYGLNLQQGGHIIVWFGTGWNLEMYQQANARLDRQGQTAPVIVYNLVCRGTVDERALAALTGKADTQQALMDSIKEMIAEY